MFQRIKKMMGHADKPTPTTPRPRAAPRIQIQPLHNVCFQILDERSHDHLHYLQIGNISTSGIGFLKGSFPRWPEPDQVIKGEILMQNENFRVLLKIVHHTTSIVGCLVIEKPPHYDQTLNRYFALEISALNMILTKSELLEQPPEGIPIWLHGDNNCEIYFVEKSKQVLNFHLSFFGNYFEGALGSPVRYGLLQEDETVEDEERGYKDTMGVQWVSAIPQDMLEQVLLFIKHVPHLSPDQRAALSELLHTARK